MQKDELLTKMSEGYAEFTAYLRALTPEQPSVLTDAVGWTIKDHVMHAATWEDSVWALLTKQPRAEVMGVDPALIDAWDVEGINAAVQARTHGLPFAEVMRRFATIHQRLMAQMAVSTDAEINAPLVDYLPEVGENYRNEPIYLYIAGNTYEHYEEHRPWLDAIARLN